MKQWKWWMLAAGAFVPSVAVAVHEDLVAVLTGFEEVPAISSPGRGRFEGTISNNKRRIPFTLTYSRLPTPVAAAHIHVGQRGVNGGIVAFLCGGEGGTECPNDEDDEGRFSGEVVGELTPESIDGRPEQGIEPGAIGKVIRAIRNGVAYVNVHTEEFPGGEVRGQIVIE